MSGRAKRRRQGDLCHWQCFTRKGLPVFGRQRRAAPAIQAPAAEPGDEQIFELLHGTLSELIGAHGRWTLVPRQSDDTDVIFHGMKAHQIATTLTALLQAQKAALRGEAVSAGEHAAEPAALSWTPAPISVWAEPERATVTASIQLPATQSIEKPRLVA